MTTAIGTALAAACSRHTARHLAGIGFCDSCAQVSANAGRAAERRQYTQMTALIYAR
ncbi:hypothetical protein ACF09G_25895 [Streptomyces albogriseolus]|uniref:hypothetical protein n=1 Tax=Streptomyces albogriseolus TaxID=1887 RepID=UPI0036F4C0C7